MDKIKITWLEHHHDCETCGSSYAVGAIVHIADHKVMMMEPIAHCYNSENYYPEDVYKRILSELGYTVEEETDVES